MRFAFTALSMVLLAPALMAAEESSRSLAEKLGLQLNGFIDGRAGTRTQPDPNQPETSLGELRLQLEALRYFDAATVEVRADFVYDWAPGDTDVDLEEGTGWVDLRDAYVSFSPHSIWDVKLGRQILTWGTGDLLFINDLFPKDWQSFFIGRDVEYLKAPSDAILVSAFPSWASLDLVYAPRFDSDRFIRGDRISFWHPTQGEHVGQNNPTGVDKPDEVFTDDEVSARAYRNIGSYEMAAYGYSGFWKSPAGYEPTTDEFTFPALAVYGASTRGPLAGGIANVELGYYDSLDDTGGDDPLVRNSEARFLAGYERELVRNLTGALQYYLEHMMDHEGYLAGLPPDRPAADENRHLLTLRLTQQLMNQNLVLSLFTYYSPSDEDAYIRPIITYKATDNWMLNAGANVFLGRNEHTFFGQFEDATNIYGGARYSF